MNQSSREYLHSRGITDEAIKRFKIEGDEQKIIIPIKGFNKYRTFPEKNYFYDKGYKAALFGVEQLNGSTWCVLTEGELDALRLASIGIPAVSGTGGAGTFKQEWIQELPKHVLICYDTDRAGKENAEKIHWAIAGSRVIQLPDEYKDVTDYLVMHSKEDFEGLIQKSVVIPRPEVKLVYRVIKPRLEKGEDIQRAKSVPIPSFIKFKQNKAKCLWHEEKTASLHFYPDSNTLYCYGCNKRADVIDVVMRLENLNLKEAIVRLIKQD